MFEDKSSDVVGFNSQISIVKPTISTNIQTAEIDRATNYIQVAEARNAETQTEVKQKIQSTVNYDKLAGFLKRIAPSIIGALDDTYNTNAFDDYDLQTTSGTSACAELLTKFNSINESSVKMKISDLSWSTGGGSLIVSHSIMYHEAWCDHSSQIQLYSLSAEEKFIDVPSKIIDVNSCVTALSYHPSEPSILAAGLFNGDVLLWNLRDEDSFTPMQIDIYNDTVSRIHWNLKILNDISFLVSSSRDGYISVHKLMTNFTTVSLHKRFKIIKEHNPKERTRPRSAGGRQERASEAGLCITSFDFSWENPSLFIVGTLCGGVYKCSLDSTVYVEDDKSLLDPVIDEYEKHQGSVTCVKCSPTRNFFVTSGTDKDVRIYTFDQYTSNQSFSVENTVIGLTWMIGNRDIFAAYGAGTTIRFYDVTTGKTVTNVKLEVESTTSLRVNSKRDMLAIGDVHGNVEIWKIPRQIF